MKRLFWILPFLLLFSCNNYRASRGPADWLYISPTGNNTTGDGSSGNPWATPAYAVTQASAGDTIFFQAGTYTISASVTVPVQVSLYSNVAAVCSAGGAVDAMFMLSSASEGTNGNQTISGLTFDGNDSTGYRAIAVIARSNVKIHDNTFQNFYRAAIRYTGRVTGDGEPTTYATGNEIYDNTIIDCARDVWSTSYYSAGGAVEISGQSGMLIHGNYIDGGARHGYGIKGVANNGYHKGLKIYDNTVIMNTRHLAHSWNFAIELWSQRGGVEIYDNVIKGAIDLGGLDTNDDGGYGYAAKIYRNNIGHDALPSGGNIAGIAVELGQHGGLYIYQNRFHHVEVAINCQTTSQDVVPGQNDIYIYYNIFHDLGLTSGAYTGKALYFNAEGAYTSTWDNIQFVNNTVYNPTKTGKTIMDCEDSGNTFTNIVFRNNICQGFYDVVKWDAGTVDTLSIENNLTYQVTNLYNLTGATVTNSTIDNNIITTAPAFQTNSLRLSSASPCINAGLSVGLTSDYFGHRVPQQDTVDIGAHEYGDYLVKFGGKYLRDGNGKFKIIH